MWNMKNMSGETRVKEERYCMVQLWKGANLIQCWAEGEDDDDNEGIVQKIIVVCPIYPAKKEFYTTASTCILIMLTLVASSSSHFCIKYCDQIQVVERLLYKHYMQIIHKIQIYCCGIPNRFQAAVVILAHRAATSSREPKPSRFASFNCLKRLLMWL